MRLLSDRKRALARLLRRFPIIPKALRCVLRFFGARFTAGVVGIVLDSEGRVLLVEHVFHPLRPWGLPGGWLQADERPADALVREIAEETGLQVEVLRPLLIDTSAHDAKHLDIAFLCSPRGDVTALNPEILAYDWVRLDAVPQLLDFHQAAVDVLREQHLLQEIET